MSRAGRAHRRTVGIGVLTVLFASSGLAVLLAQMYHLGMPQTISAVMVGGGSLSALFLSWVAYSPQEPSLAGMADDLADEIRRQWEGEAEQRGLNEPYPLPVSWVGDPSVADTREKLDRLASAGAGWPAPPPPGTWATDPADLAGCDKELVKVLARVPTGRLVVLGEPGAGKTILMVRLVLDLLAQRQSGDPVPVLCPVGSWNPLKQGLDQ